MDRIEKKQADLELSNAVFKRRADQASNAALEASKLSFRKLIKRHGEDSKGILRRHEEDRKGWLQKLAESRKELILAKAERAAQWVQLAKYAAYCVGPVCLTFLLFWYVPRR